MGRSVTHPHIGAQNKIHVVGVALRGLDFAKKAQSWGKELESREGWLWGEVGDEGLRAETGLSCGGMICRVGQGWRGLRGRPPKGYIWGEKTSTSFLSLSSYASVGPREEAPLLAIAALGLWNSQLSAGHRRSGQGLRPMSSRGINPYHRPKMLARHLLGCSKAV